MNELFDSNPRLRRRADLPVLVLSQDYELFFQSSGTVENCLVKPCDLLLAFAEDKALRITFFVDAGMLCRMQELSHSEPQVARQFDQVRRHLEGIVAAGHELGLHVHPHWQETEFHHGGWRFSGTRYQLRDYSDAEVAEIFRTYTRALNELAGYGVTTYRAGGFCIEPFARIRGALVENGLFIDSSVVPGAQLVDHDKGFDFTEAPDQPWWRFSESPAVPDANGRFVEIAITPFRLPARHYWGRLANRVLGLNKSDALGDGTSKPIGPAEILRRLAGRGQVSELSVDAPKARHLLSRQVRGRQRSVWQVMGHPKLLGPSSLDALQKFIDRNAIQSTMTVGEFAAAVAAEQSVDGACGR